MSEENEESVSQPNLDIHRLPGVSIAPPMGQESAREVFEALKAADANEGNLNGSERNLIGVQIPIVPNLDRSILSILEEERGALNMSSWHGTSRQNMTRAYGWRTDNYRCGTTHCRAGWAIALAGSAGFALEDKFGSWTAGCLIYWKSAGHIPDFFESEKKAIEDIRQRAIE
jgi:hypothetical protein